jgi:hypothetical protein
MAAPAPARSMRVRGDAVEGGFGRLFALLQGFGLSSFEFLPIVPKCFT